MFLTVYACASEYKTVIEFIEIRLKDGRVLTLNWDESENGEYDRYYKGIHFAETDEKPTIEILKGLKVTNVGLYSEHGEKIFITIDRMDFFDESGSISFVCPYSNYLAEVPEEYKNRLKVFIKGWLKKYDYDLKSYYPLSDDPPAGCCNVDIANDIKSDFEESDLNPFGPKEKEDPMYPAEFDMRYEEMIYECIIPIINELMHEAAESV